MSSPSGGVSGSGSAPKPAESRRWLKPRLPREQLYRLAPARPRPKRFGTTEFPEQVRHVLRVWWVWLAVAAALQLMGRWPWAIAAGILAFFQYLSLIHI